MKIGITVSLGGYESFKFESNEWPTSYECAMEIIHEIRKMGNYNVESYALNYLAEFIAKPEVYKGNESKGIIKRIKKWLKGDVTP